MDITVINENISRLTIPYKDIYTTVYLIKCGEEYMLFDAASFDEDTENYLVPFLEKAGVTEENLKYVFISHNHKDHSGGLPEFIKHFSKTAIISRSADLKENLSDYKVLCPEDGEVFLGCLETVAIKGHTLCSQALYDRRSKILITGDCFQAFGILGSGMWGANIRLPKEHFEALDKVSKMDIETIYAAHDYEPYGHTVSGREMVLKYIGACREPLLNIKKLIAENSSLSPEEIAEKYNSDETLPKIGAWVAEAIKKDI